MQPQEFMDFVHTLERMKCNTRHSYTGTLRHESVAEHTFRIAAMALLLEGEFPQLDMARVIKMCLVHDWARPSRATSPRSSRRTATKRAKRTRWTRCSPACRSAGRSSPPFFAELNALETPEAQLFKALDRIEAVIQHNEAPLSTWIERERTLNLEYGVEDCARFPFMAQLRENSRRGDTAEARARGMSAAQPCQPARRSSASERASARLTKAARKSSPLS